MPDYTTIIKRKYYRYITKDFPDKIYWYSVDKIGYISKH